MPVHLVLHLSHTAWPVDLDETEIAVGTEMAVVVGHLP